MSNTNFLILRNNFELPIKSTRNNYLQGILLEGDRINCNSQDVYQVSSYIFLSQDKS